MSARVARRRFVAVVVGLTLAGAGCGGGSSKPADESIPAQQYVVDGILTQLPSTPGRELMIRHVAIPGFVNASGDTVGMNAMTMGFPLGDPSIVEGFAPGDSIRFVFEVRWGASTPLRLTAMEHLPPGSVLEFGKSPSAGGQDPKGSSAEGP